MSTPLLHVHLPIPKVNHQRETELTLFLNRFPKMMFLITRLWKTKLNLENIEDNEKHLIEAHQNVPGEAAKQPFVQETNSDNNRDGTIFKAPVEPSPPRHAWAIPRVEEPGSSGVKITNPFPSPVPPVDKSAVHPPICPVNDNRMGNKKHTLGKKGKEWGGKTATTCKTKPRTKSKVPEKNIKGSKKTGKAKKKK